MIYLDTSALAKLIVRETETAALGQCLQQRTAQLWVTSIITLDAVHLASALSVRDELAAFCCYDHRLLDAAKDAGLPIHAPGR